MLSIVPTHHYILVQHDSLRHAAADKLPRACRSANSVPSDRQPKRPPRPSGARTTEDYTRAPSSDAGSACTAPTEAFFRRCVKTCPPRTPRLPKMAAHTDILPNYTPGLQDTAALRSLGVFMGHREQVLRQVAYAPRGRVLVLLPKQVPEPGALHQSVQ